jgi:hypothetical protein
MSKFEIKLSEKEANLILKLLSEHLMEAECSNNGVPRWQVELYFTFGTNLIKHKERGKYAKELHDTIARVRNRLQL